MGKFLTGIFLFLLLLGCGPQNGVKQPSAHLSDDELKTLQNQTALADSLADQADDIPASERVLEQTTALAEKAGRVYPGYRFFRRRVMNRMAEKPAAALSFARTLTEQYAQPDDSLSGFFCSLYGWTLWNTGDYRAAIPVLERAASLFEQFGLTKRLGGVYNNLGVAYGQLGDHERAIETYEAALLLNKTNKDTLEMSKNHYNIAKAMLNLGDFAQSEMRLRLAHQLEPEDDGSYDFQMAELDAARNRPEQALQRIRQLETKRADLFDPKQNGTADQLLACGEIYLAAGQAAQAAKLLQKALPGLVDGGWQRGKALNLLGDAHLKTAQAQTALHDYQQSIQSFLPGFKPGDDRENPPADALPPDVWAMEALRGKAESLSQIFDLKQQPADLRAALETWEHAARLIQKLKQAFSEDASRLSLGAYTFESFYEKPIQIALKLAEISGDSTYQAKALFFSGESKAGVLRAALAEKKQLLDAHVSTDSMQQLHALRLGIAGLERQIAAGVDSLRPTLFRLKRNYQKYLNSLHLPPSTVNPPPSTVHRLPSTLTPSTALDSIRRRLPDSGLLVEYFAGKKQLYIFSISKTNFQATVKPLTPDFERLTSQFYQITSDWQWIKTSPAQAEQTWLRTSSSLYDFLLKDALAAHPDCNRLFIVPDGALTRLPFAALLTRPYEGSWKDNDLPVLIKKMAVSYLFSSSFWAEQGPEKQEDTRYGFGGFGSDYRDGLTLASLPKSKDPASQEMLLAMRGGPDTLDFADDEVDSISTLVGGQKWLNAQATKTNFLKYAGNCRILHTSLHTIETDAADPTGLAILFSKISETDPNILTSNELYALDLHAALTVVSACQSGFGQFKQGEGSLSLGRAIALAGCPTTVVNLWKADDRASKDLMVAFYKNLKAGQPKDQALQHAMTYYLENTVSDKAPPLFWANFVAIGDMAPLIFEEDGGVDWWRWVLAGLAILLVGWLAIRDRIHG
jgi:CHAT domain-containing protein/tetratricopeptide (TPR) repeat protein